MPSVLPEMDRRGFLKLMGTTVAASAVGLGGVGHFFPAATVEQYGAFLAVQPGCIWAPDVAGALVQRFSHHIHHTAKQIWEERALVPDLDDVAVIYKRGINIVDHPVDVHDTIGYKFRAREGTPADWLAYEDAAYRWEVGHGGRRLLMERLQDLAHA